MQATIAYWTSFVEPRMEAIGREVQTLRRHFPHSLLGGLSARVGWFGRFGRSSCVLHPRWHLALRAAAAVLRPWVDLHHVFGSLGDWFYLKAADRRPTVLTAALPVAPADRGLLERVSQFVVETPACRSELEKAGVARHRISVIFPGVDLNDWPAVPTPAGPFRILFASSPDKADALDARGVGLLLEAAAGRPDCQFILLWRPWGDSFAALRQRLAAAGLPNVLVRRACVEPMSRVYASVHCTVAPFTRRGWFKPCPNSVVEGLACARPAIVTDLVGIAELLHEARAGVVCPPHGQALVEAIDRLRADYPRYQRAARRCAERYFDVAAFVAGYRRVYQLALADSNGALHRCGSRTS